MCYTYVLRSDHDQRLYTGTTRDLRGRLKLHANGKVVYYEACLETDDAFRRERFLKTGKGKRFLRNRLASFLARISTNKLERH